ncbi:hypothetical protein HanLR1_Chr17g0668141 [Helianthus annuus]|nr:hypothetical protein HanHA89_Chr17g0709581 [Helianthus annuus]KAJ0632708.1 hypothetical protein HanLR1_Chr17g0668141 [Helianthus annuus]
MPGLFQPFDKRWELPHAFFLPIFGIIFILRETKCFTSVFKDKVFDGFNLCLSIFVLGIHCLSYQLYLQGIFFFYSLLLKMQVWLNMGTHFFCKVFI